MKTTFYLIVGVLGFALSGRAADPAQVPPEPMHPLEHPLKPVPVQQAADAPFFKNLSELKWEKILPDLGDSSPEICILHVDPTTHATQLMIRAPKAIHV